MESCYLREKILWRRTAGSNRFLHLERVTTWPISRVRHKWRIRTDLNRRLPDRQSGALSRYATDPLGAGAGVEPASQVYEACGLPLSHPASKLVHVGGLEPPLFTTPGHSFTGCCRRRWATHAWRRWRELNPRCRLSTDTPVFGTGDFTQLVHISKLEKAKHAKLNPYLVPFASAEPGLSGFTFQSC